MSTIATKFAEYQSDIAACFKGSDRDAMSKICQALEYYARAVGLGDDRVKRGIDGLETLILQAADKVTFTSFDASVVSFGEPTARLSESIALRYGRSQVKVTFKGIVLEGVHTPCKYGSIRIGRR